MRSLTLRSHNDGSYCIYQRFQHINEANGSFCVILTHKSRVHAVLNKRSFDCRLNFSKSYWSLTFRWSVFDKKKYVRSLLITRKQRNEIIFVQIPLR